MPNWACHGQHLSYLAADYHEKNHVKVQTDWLTHFWEKVKKVYKTNKIYIIHDKMWMPYAPSSLGRCKLLWQRSMYNFSLIG